MANAAMRLTRQLISIIFAIVRSRSSISEAQIPIGGDLAATRRAKVPTHLFAFPITGNSRHTVTQPIHHAEITVTRQFILSRRGPERTEKIIANSVDVKRGVYATRVLI